jgi:hypothetical protein
MDFNGLYIFEKIVKNPFLIFVMGNIKGFQGEIEKIPDLIRNQKIPHYNLLSIMRDG